MKTDDLISVLATGAEAIEPGAVRRRYMIALGLGVPVAALLMLLILGLRPDLAAAAWLPMFWVKLAFPAALLAGALLAAMRLTRPGARLGRVLLALAAPVLAIWLLAAVALFAAVPGERETLVFGDTWTACLISVPLLSLPLFLASLWAMKGLAPTRLALAGAAAGLLSGAGGALVYALHCPELAAPFLGVWYLLGMLIPTVLGALLGPRLLRW